MTAKIPEVAIIGAGRFGRHHLAEWQRLAADGKVKLKAVVVRTDETGEAIAREFDVPVVRDLESVLVDGVDGVDIVTPADTHFDLVRQCLEHTNVLVEKPAAASPEQVIELEELAKRHNRLLMVGHVYRFHPLVEELKSMVSRFGRLPKQITGSMINPYEPGVEQLDPRLEFLHLFDIVDYLFGLKPTFSLSCLEATSSRISLRYPGPINAILHVGWRGDETRRKLSLYYDDQRIDCNLADNSIVINRRDEIDKIFLDPRPQALRSELSRFLDLIGGNQAVYPDAAIAARIVRVATQANLKTPSRPRVAVVGGGIFGITCAIELGRFCDVTLFERHADVMTEASYLNQWRHHSGFHYPRSPQTVEEVVESRQDFMERYGEAVLLDIPSYFATSASGKEITAERYLAVCKAGGLNFEIENPPGAVLDASKVSLCLRTDEAIFDYHHLKSLVESELAANPRIELALNTEVVVGDFASGGVKRLAYRSENEVGEAEFDFVVNATYANRNLMAKWFQFPARPLRFDLLELLVLEIDIPRVSITVLDGPFTSLTSMGRDNLFMLSHIHESIIKSVVRKDEPPPEWPEVESNRHNLIKHALKYFPLLENSRVVESRYGIRAVYAYSEDFDGRPTVVNDHGFGCWSVLGGKVITCVTNAREIADNVKKYMSDSG